MDVECNRVRFFEEGSQILTNQKRESTVFWLLIDFKKFLMPGEIF